MLEYIGGRYTVKRIVWILMGVPAAVTLYVFANTYLELESLTPATTLIYLFFHKHRVLAFIFDSFFSVVQATLKVVQYVFKTGNLWDTPFLAPFMLFLVLLSLFFLYRSLREVILYLGK